MPEMTAEEYAQYLKELAGGTALAYETYNLDLTTANAAPGTEIKISGRYLYVFPDTYLGSIYVRFNHPASSSISLEFANGLPIDFSKVYIQNPAYSGKTLHLLALKHPITSIATPLVFQTYAGGPIQVGRAVVGLSTTRLTAAGNFKATAGNLFWLTIRPSAAVWLAALTNQATTGGTVIWDIGDPVGSAPIHINFDPPREFSTAIRLETATNLASATAGYI